MLRHRLDHGGGRDLSLKECTREQLEREVFYLFTATDVLSYAKSNQFPRVAHHVRPAFLVVFSSRLCAHFANRYLSAEQRASCKCHRKWTYPDLVIFCRSGLNYLVEIDSQGKLRWARN